MSSSDEVIFLPPLKDGEEEEEATTPKKNNNGVAPKHEEEDDEEEGEEEDEEAPPAPPPKSDALKLKHQQEGSTSPALPPYRDHAHREGRAVVTTGDLSGATGKYPSTPPPTLPPARVLSGQIRSFGFCFFVWADCLLSRWVVEVGWHAQGEQSDEDTGNGRAVGWRWRCGIKTVPTARGAKGSISLPHGFSSLVGRQ